MRIENVRLTYHQHATKASDIIRQLGFAGIGLIWILRDGSGDQLKLGDHLFPAGFFIVVALACDLFEYVTGTLVWGIYHWHIRRVGRGEDQVFAPPAALNWPVLFFFWTKTLFMIFAYINLLASLSYRIDY
jgi:hypothetical protein